MSRFGLLLLSAVALSLFSCKGGETEVNLLQQKISLEEELQALGEESTNLWRQRASQLLVAIAEKDYYLGNLDTAESNLEKALVILKRYKAPEGRYKREPPPVFYRLQRLLGRVKKRLGKHSEASEIFRVGWELSRNFVGIRSLDTEKWGLELADSMNSAGQIVSARLLFEQFFSRQMRKNHKDITNLDYEAEIFALVGIGDTYRSEGKYEDSIPFYLRAMETSELREAAFDPDSCSGCDHMYTSRLLMSLADSYIRTGREGEAVPLLLRLWRYYRRKRALALKELREFIDEEEYGQIENQLLSFYLKSGRQRDLSALKSLFKNGENVEGQAVGP